MTTRKGTSRTFNPPLFWGVLILLIMTALAVIGPHIAPRDPLEQTNILQINGEWQTPPYAPGTADFLLGSDAFGRDILSQLLWAIRPTLLMVMAAALTRIILGLILGIYAGWGNGMLRHALNLLIALALSVPTLLVALVVISKAGAQRSLSIFILGLVLTGWAETAQTAREQTHLLRQQTYIEATRALGASSFEILSRHIWRQIQPMLGMLFTFEVGNTLLVVAELGFLGQFIGGSAAIAITDSVSREAPRFFELGQVLSTSIEVITQPWGMLAGGTLVFVLVLGFNLFGQGLQRRAHRPLANHWSAHARLRLEQVVWQFNHRAAWQKRALSAIGLTAAILTALFWIDFPGSQTSLPSNIAAPSPTIQIQPANQAAGVAASATPEIPAIMLTPEWSTDLPEGLQSAPILAANGDIYLLSKTNQVHILTPDGIEKSVFKIDAPPTINRQRHLIAPTLLPDGNLLIAAADQVFAVDIQGTVLWQLPLDSPPESCCTLSEDGSQVYLLDQESHLLAFDRQTGWLWTWQFESDFLQRPQTPPLVGPNGIIYFAARYNRDGWLAALQPDGSLIWLSKFTLPANVADNWSMEMDHSQNYLLLNNMIFSAQDGALMIDSDALPKTARFFSSEDGLVYLLDEYRLKKWRLSDQPTMVQEVNWENLNYGTADQAGVTRDGYLWLLFAFGNASKQMVWVDLATGQARQQNIPGGFQIAAVDAAHGVFTLCGMDRDSHQGRCFSSGPSSNQPIWDVTIDGMRPLKYAHLNLENGRLTLFTRQNTLLIVNTRQ